MVVLLSFKDQSDTEDSIITRAMSTLLRVFFKDGVVIQQQAYGGMFTDAQIDAPAQLQSEVCLAAGHILNLEVCADAEVIAARERVRERSDAAVAGRESNVWASHEVEG